MCVCVRERKAKMLYQVQCNCTVYRFDFAVYENVQGAFV